MSSLVTVVVPIASTVTAAGAVATARYARKIVATVGENEDRSTSNRELLIGDPDALDHNLVERVGRLEEEVET